MPKQHTPALTPKKRTAVKRAINLTLDPDLIACLDERGDNRSEGIRRDGLRYYRLLADTRRVLRDQFTEPELALLCDACNGWCILSPEDCRSIDHQVADACRLDRLHEKWGVADPLNLVARLRGLTLLEAVALCDAIERFWHAVGEGDARRNPERMLD